MSRESSIANAMVEMAEGLVSDFDVAYLLTGLAGYSVELLGVTASGVMLASPDGELRIMASSSESMHVLELFELQSNEGPCLDAYRTGETIENHRLDVSGDRWPEYSKAAIRAGFNSVMAVPMRLREATIGTLDLFGRDEITLSVADMHIAQAFANMAAVTILQYRAIAQSNLVNQQLTYALNSRIVIEQAKGIVAERAKVDLESAFYLLRRYARSHSLKLVDVARAATEGRIDIASLLAQNRPGLCGPATDELPGQLKGWLILELPGRPAERDTPHDYSRDACRTARNLERIPPRYWPIRLRSQRTACSLPAG